MATRSDRPGSLRQVSLLVQATETATVERKGGVVMPERFDGPRPRRLAGGC